MTRSGGDFLLVTLVWLSKRLLDCGSNLGRMVKLSKMTVNKSQALLRGVILYIEGDHFGFAHTVH